MVLILNILLALTLSAHSESESTRVSSGFSIGGGGVQLVNPAGSGLGVNFDGRFLSSQISLTGSPGKGTSSGGYNGAPRILPRLDSSQNSDLTNQDAFFKNIGKSKEPQAPYRRPGVR